MTLSAGGRDAAMGDMLAIGAVRKLRGTIHVRSAAGTRAVLRVGGSARRIILPSLAGDDTAVPFRITGLGRARWIRTDVITPDAATIPVGYPVYLQHRADAGADGSRGDRCDG